MELIIVLAILGILLFIALPIFSDMLLSIRQKALRADLHNIERATWFYYMNTGVFPQGETSGNASADLWNNDSRRLFVEFEAGHGSNPDTEVEWGGPYLNTWPGETPIGGIYAYRYFEAGNTWAFDNIRNYATGEGIPEAEATEFIMIRFTYITDDTERREKRDEALAYLSEALNPRRVYYVPGAAQSNHNTGWIGIRLFR